MNMGVYMYAWIIHAILPYILIFYIILILVTLYDGDKMIQHRIISNLRVL